MREEKEAPPAAEGETSFDRGNAEMDAGGHRPQLGDLTWAGIRRGPASPGLST
jgi:hypothetical protein